MNPAVALPPQDVKAYALPGGTLRARDGSLQDGGNVAGLLWNTGRRPGPRHLPQDRAVMYHVWRADANGDGPPPDDDQYRCLTAEHRVVVTNRPKGRPAAEHLNPSWPPYRLHFLDRGTVSANELKPQTPQASA